jgi:hypothetical protein
MGGGARRVRRGGRPVGAGSRLEDGAHQGQAGVEERGAGQALQAGRGPAGHGGEDPLGV